MPTNSRAVIVFALIAGSLCCNKTSNQGPVLPVDMELEVITENLDYPWELIWGPDNFIWMTERNGRVSRLNPANGNVTPLLTIPDVVSIVEGGLLGMALHPNFLTTPHVFVVYNYNQSQYREKIVRYTYNGTTLINPLIIFDNVAAAPVHNGSRLMILGDKLFVTTGDAADLSTPQNTSSVNGKILRLNLDGSIPADNPIPNNPAWSWGHRNPQGLTFGNNMIYSSEHGPSTDDEINIIEKGRNYGWPTVGGECDNPTEQAFCNANNVKIPIAFWTPTIAPSGMGFYDHDEIPQFKNSLLLTTLKGARFIQLKLSDDGKSITSIENIIEGDYGRLRDICISPEGKIYISTSNGNNDKIILLRKK